MKVLTAEMIAKSFEGSAKLDDNYVKYDDRHLHFTHPEAAQFTIRFPKKVEQLPYFVRSLALLGYEQIHFRGAKIWFTDAGIWDEFLEGIGYQILESMNTAAGQPMSFWEARGYDFRADELVKTLGVLIQPMIFGWDAYYLPSGCSEYFLKISHHSCVDVHTKSKDFHDKAIKELVASEEDFYVHPDKTISRYFSLSELMAMGKYGEDGMALPEVPWKPS